MDRYNISMTCVDVDEQRIDDMEIDYVIREQSYGLLQVKRVTRKLIIKRGKCDDNYYVM